MTFMMDDADDRMLWGVPGVEGRCWDDCMMTYFCAEFAVTFGVVGVRGKLMLC